MNTKTYAWAALGLALVVPNTLVSGEYTSGKEVYDSKGVIMFEESPYKVDVYGGASAVYNSNTTQLPGGIGAWVGIFDFGFDFKSANQNGRGAVYGFGYDGAAYWWESNAARFGRDPLEHRLDGYVGVNGGKTRFRLNVDYYRNNGNNMDFNAINREARPAQSHDFNFDATVVRDLDRGSLEFGGGYYMRDFDAGTFLNDQDSYYGDIAWFHNPGFAPKSSLGLGFRFGRDEFQRNVNQDFYNTSFRWRHRATGKTTAYGSLGWENRSSTVTGGGSVDNFVFDIGVNWQATDKTTLDFVVAQAIRPSYSTVGSDFKSLGFVAKLSHDLPGLWSLDARAGYENADYFPTTAVANPVALIREDNFLRLGVSVSHPVTVCQDVNGSVSIFYNYNENDSTVAPSNFSQNIAGLRFGFLY